MKFTVFIMLSLFLFSCSYNTVRFLDYNSQDKCSIIIPTGYNLVINKTSIEQSREYIYSDGSIVYLGNYECTPNYDNLKTVNDSLFSLRFNNFRILNQIDSLKGGVEHKVADKIELYGMSNDSLCWRDIRIGNICYGYLKVGKENKLYYDKVLETFKLNKKR